VILPKMCSPDLGKKSYKKYGMFERYISPLCWAGRERPIFTHWHLGLCHPVVHTRGWGTM